jgi:hypothetical protein
MRKRGSVRRRRCASTPTAYTARSTASSAGERSMAERIDIKDQGEWDRWAKKLDASHEQIREAIEAVGDDASDVEMHLKGVRSTSNDDRVEKALKGDWPGTTDKPR